VPLPGSNAAAAGAPAGGGRQGGPGQQEGVAAERPNWDAPYVISPHSPKRLYWASNFLYRSDTWDRISPGLSRQLDPIKIPIMGKLWVPAETVSWNAATTALSNIVSLDESPLLEGLPYAGTDDGLPQASEDGGKNWRRVERFPGVPDGTYVTDVFASPRDANAMFVALNDWQRGDFKPYLLKSTDRGRTFTSIAGDLPDRQNVYAVAQDHANGDLLFAGTEFGLFVTVDGGRRWVLLRGGLPTVQVYDPAVQRRENYLVLGTFGRSFYVLDDYSPLREMSAQALAEEARVFPLRDASLYGVLGQQQAVERNWAAANPPYGAVITYHVAQPQPADTRLVLTITDASGRTIRQLVGRDADNSIPQTPGVHRVAWDLRADAPPPAPAAVPGAEEGRERRPGRPGRRRVGWAWWRSAGAGRRAGFVSSDARLKNRGHREAYRSSADICDGANPAVSRPAPPAKSFSDRRPAGLAMVQVKRLHKERSVCILLIVGAIYNHGANPIPERIEGHPRPRMARPEDRDPERDPGGALLLGQLRQVHGAPTRQEGLARAAAARAVPACARRARPGGRGRYQSAGGRRDSGVALLLLVRHGLHPPRTDRAGLLGGLPRDTSPTQAAVRARQALRLRAGG
jgi:hypothetical protein